MNKLIGVLTVFFLSVVLPPFLTGQGSVVYYGKPVGGTAKSAALGGAVAGDAFGVHSMYGNPAAVRFAGQSSLAMSAFADVYRLSLDMTLSFQPISLSENQSLSFGFSESVYGKKLPEYPFSYYGPDIGYAVSFDPRFSVGGILNLRFGTTPVKTMFASSGSIGLLYHPSDEISYGIIVDGIGNGINYIVTDVEQYAYQEYDIRNSVRVGLSFQFPSVYRQPFFGMSLESQKIIGVAETIYRGGIEITPVTPFTARIGIITQSRSTAGTFGFAWNLNPVLIEYAVSPKISTNRYHQLSAAILFAP